MIKTVKGTGANLSRSSKVVGRDKAPVSYLKSSKIAHNTKVVQEGSKMTVNYKQYNDDKQKFFKKHKNDFRCDTTPMDEYGRYWKTYNFEDGAQWCEAMCPVYEKVNVTVHEVECTVEIKFLRTEFWTTESGSKYYYEKW